MTSGDKLSDIAAQAERDLNTHSAKSGAGRTSANDEAGVDSKVEQKFPGAQVRYDQDLSTNRGYNKRIPPEEGGDLDARGRQTKGEHFEGSGGPEDKLAQQQRDFGGENTFDLTGKRQAQHNDNDQGAPGGDVYSEGKAAVQSNLNSDGRPREKNKFPGSEYYTPESVPGSVSAQGYEAPDSVTQAAREA